MTMRKETAGPRRRWSLAAIFALLLAVALPLVAPFAGATQEESDWKHVLVVYTTDVKGKIEPCG